MLNYAIAMFASLVPLVIMPYLIFFAPGKQAESQTSSPTALVSATAQIDNPALESTPVVTPTVSIQYPSPGQALQGSIAISGNTMLPGFFSSELLFAYQDDPTNTWFLIQEFTRPIAGGTLALWDTTLLTDGTYQLRLVVRLEDGTQSEYRVSGLRVRNYTPIETSTPTPVTPTATVPPGITPTLTPTPTIVPPTATPLPTNPAEITPQELNINLGKGALAALGLFALFGIYQLVRGRHR